MQDKPTIDKETRERLEADHTFTRIVELELDPVRGNFDAAHLKEVNRRIFKDLPGAGLTDVTPGQFREPVEEGRDWLKQRVLKGVMGGPTHVAYSSMDKAAEARLAKALEQANPSELGRLKTPEFTKKIAGLYAELDYIHPFKDGNSRTLRTFTRQLAREAGYDIDWGRFGNSDVGRTLLYIARDRSVNELAMPHMKHEHSVRLVLNTKFRLNESRDLPDLLSDAIRPTRAIAFEQRSEREAVKAHPELQEAYQTMQTATKYFAEKWPGKLDAQEVGIQGVMSHIQARLDAGETSNFNRGREQSRAPDKESNQDHLDPGRER